MKILLSNPERFCLKKTGPLDDILIKKIIHGNKNKQENNKTINEKIIC